MEPWRTLVDAYELEDRLLRELVGNFPHHWRELPGPDEALSCRATLSHLAFWYGFTVDFFRRRKEPGHLPASPPEDFDAQDRRALASWADLPFGEILARYLEASHEMREFLAGFWDRLTPRQQAEFRIPLRHHRDHRLALARTLVWLEEHNQPDTMASGA